MASDRDDYLLMPLRGLRDHGKPKDDSFLEDAPKVEKSREQLEKERVEAAEAEAERARAEAMQSMGAEKEVLEAPSASGIDVDFSTKEKRGAVVVKLCRIERFVRDSDVEIITHLFNYVDGPTLGALTTSSKNLYMRVKSTQFLLQMTLKGLSKLSSNIRRGVGYGMVQNCRLSVGIADERCGLNTVNGIAAFFTSAYPAKCTLERLTIQADESANDVSIHAFVHALNNKHSNNIVHLSFEGTGLQTRGVSLFCDIARKGALKRLQELNVSRNKALYNGIHKLAKVIAEERFPNLHTLNISDNDAKHAVLDFFDRKFAESTPFLKHLIAQGNLLDIYDPDVVAQRLRGSGKLSWNNFHTLDLSRNTLVDVEFAKMISTQIWVLEDLRTDSSGNFTHKSEMRKLCFQEIEMGNNTMQVLSTLMVRGYFPNLQMLDVGTNAMDQQGIDVLLEPLRRGELRELTHLNVSLNKIHHDGLLLVAASQTLGVFDRLVELDISDIGCNTETIALFAKAIIDRFDKGLIRLDRLRVIGHHPFAGKNVRVMFPPKFLIRVKVT